MCFLVLLCFVRLEAADPQSILAYPLPDALTLKDGRPVTTAGIWERERRPQILTMFAEQVYGKTPSVHAEMSFAVTAEDDEALGGKAIRKEILLTFRRGDRTRQFPVLLYLPAHHQGAIPVLIELSFAGNDKVELNPDGERWPVSRLIADGIGLASAGYNSIEPDHDGKLMDGVRYLFLPPGSEQFAPDEWGAIGAWAWGLSRIADYLETVPAIDSHRLAIFGFSRLGKAALWAAAQDQRFSIVISNESGVGGASLYRAKAGETIQHLNTAFPHWFCRNFHQYTGHPEQVPVDGNLLLSLIAPRPLYVASAEGDTNSNPAAEFLSTESVGAVYALYGDKGLPANGLPLLNQPLIGNAVAYHERSGPHEVTTFDWDQYLRFLKGQWH